MRQSPLLSVNLGFPSGASAKMMRGLIVRELVEYIGERDLKYILIDER
jgi:hypothetical protein